MIEELTSCLSCKYKRALTHYDSSGLVNWVACPKCRKYFEFEKETVVSTSEKGFWNHVEKDTGYKEGIKNETIKIFKTVT